MTTPDTHLCERARQLYGTALRHGDPAVHARLHAARQRALAAADGRHASAGRHWLMPGGAMAVIAFAAVMLWQPLQHASAPQATGSAVATQGGDVDNDLPPDAAQMDPKLYQNLDFYGWLASNDRGMGRH